MAQEIEFSIMAPNVDGIQPLLDQFESETHIHVRVRLLAWDTAWNELVKAALYSDGPDVSEIGNTWIGDLVGMNALRPFNAAEIAVFDQASAFLPSAWNVGAMQGEMHEWAIPWLVGSRLLFYRRKLLELAGIEIQTAFSSNVQLENTIRQLYEKGVQFPWTVPTGLTHTTLLNVASWVWDSGGDFISSDGKSTRFIEPPAMAGLRAYFALGRYINPISHHLNGLEPDEAFLSNDQTAMTISGPWLFQDAERRGILDQIGVALPPGASFVGGSNLVIWRYSRNVDAAIRLVRFLTQAPAQVAYSQKVGLLPARLEALASSPFSTQSYWQTAVVGLKNGRSFPAIRLWGLLEDRLASSFSAVWTDLLANPSQDPQDILIKHLKPLTRRLDVILGK